MQCPQARAYAVAAPVAKRDPPLVSCMRQPCLVQDLLSGLHLGRPRLTRCLSAAWSQPPPPTKLTGTSASIATYVWQIASKKNELEKVQDELAQVRRTSCTALPWQQLGACDTLRRRHRRRWWSASARSQSCDG